MPATEHHCSHHEDDKHTQQDDQIRKSLSHIKNKILVMSGKGGVGKSSVAAYLAVSLAKRGFAVGLMDVDLHGPSIPRLLGLKEGIGPSIQAGKALPVRFMPNLKVISIESLMGEDKDAATIWRGPLKIGVIRQFIADIDWGDLDYLIIDSPPGTGDEPLTVAQTIPDARAVIVTTPQEISLADVRKSIRFCRQVHMDILGIVENMSGLTCPHCGKAIDLFQEQGGQQMAKRENLRLLGTLPLEPLVVKAGDQGLLDILNNNDLQYTREFNTMADEIESLTAPKPIRQAIIHSSQEERDMERILFAVPLAAGKLCSHFGHCEQFALIETQDGSIKGKTLQTPPPHEPGLLPKWLHELGANVIIAGGMGARAHDLFQQNQIAVVTGAPVDTPESLVQQYLAHTLVTGANRCDH